MLEYLFLCSDVSFLCCLFFSTEEHEPEAPGVQRQPGGAPAQEKAWQSPQRPEPGALQEQSLPSPVLRPGEQPPSGTHTWQEEEEAPEQEIHNGEFTFNLTITLYEYSDYKWNKH